MLPPVLGEYLHLCIAETNLLQSICTSEIKLHRIKEILGQQIASSIWKNLQTDSSYSLLDYKKGDLACQPGNSKEK